MTQQELAALPYDEYLQTHHWRVIRQAALDHYGCNCVMCGTTKDIHVHHRTYINKGAERLRDLTVLCAEHHAQFHGKTAPPSSESKLDEWVIRIEHHLRQTGGGPFTTTRLLLDLGVPANQQRTFRNALKLGYEANRLTRTAGRTRKMPDEWALAEFA